MTDLQDIKLMVIHSTEYFSTLTAIVLSNKNKFIKINYQIEEVQGFVSN